MTKTVNPITSRPPVHFMAAKEPKVVTHESRMQISGDGVQYSTRIRQCFYVTQFINGELDHNLQKH